MSVTDEGRRAGFAAGRRLAEIALGIDALERRRSEGKGILDDEGLVPIFIGGDLVAPAAFAEWSEVFAALDALDREVGALPGDAHGAFLRSMARALRVAGRMFSGEEVSFREKLRDLVGVSDEPVPDDEVAAILGRIEALLDAAGVPGATTAERVRRWESARFLDPEAVPAMYAELLATAKARTDERIFATGDYTMALNALRGVPYAARCNFNQGKMDINLDVAVTRASLKHLVCHEVFPGHSTQLLSTRAAVAAGKSSPDALLVTANAVTGAVQEGIGDQGMALLDWIEDDDDALQLELRRLQTAVGTNAAFHLQVSGWTREESVAYMTRTGCTQTTWAQGRTTQAMHPFRGPFLASYWFGSETVRELYETTTPASRPAFLSALYDEAHSLESLRAWNG